MINSTLNSITTFNAHNNSITPSTTINIEINMNTMRLFPLLSPTSLCGVFVFSLHSRRPPPPPPPPPAAAIRPPARPPRPPTNVHQPTRTNQHTPSNAHQRTRAAAKPWQGRTLEGSGGSRARFWTRGFCVETSSLLVSRRTLEGSGGSRARFWTRGFSVEMSSLLVSRAAKPWQGRTLEGSGGSCAGFGPVEFAWKGCHFWSRGPRKCGRGVL